MRWIFALLLPPIAVLSCGKPFQFLFNIILTLCFILPGILHALLVVGSYQADRRNKELIRALGGNLRKHRSFRLS